MVPGRPRVGFTHPQLRRDCLCASCASHLTIASSSLLSPPPPPTPRQRLKAEGEEARGPGEAEAAAAAGGAADEGRAAAARCGRPGADREIAPAYARYPHPLYPPAPADIS